ncbi:MAG TPA: hypothetical protein VFL12_03165, partial [Thermoanaerobaculia bacterium]|nr:hypothetical protein [Thermoanaerobaculia bacterium]
MPDREDRELSTADLADAGRREKEAGTAVMEPAPSGSEDDRRVPLFSDEDAAGLHERWTAVQTGFVDEPREAVQQADVLVAETIRRLAESFAREKASLEEEWSRGGDISTEDLRQALRRYRSFFDRLL